MKHLLLLCALCISFFSNAQTFACNGAVDLNVTNAFMGASQPEDTVINYGCVTATGQHIWYGYFTVCGTGLLSIQVSQSTSGSDVDIVAWGPFPTTNILCNQLDSAAVASCSATPSSPEVINMGTVNAGEVYMVAVVADSATPIPVFFASGTANIAGPCPPVSNCMPVAGYEHLCVVTVDSATQEYHLVWNELAGNPVAYFGIMKEDFLGIPQQIDTVHITSPSEYIDASADPNVHTERYSIIMYDTCGTSYQTNQFIQPVFCQSSLSTQGTVNVSWSPYIDGAMNGPAYYVIYRGATVASMVSIDTVASFVNNYTDVNPLIGTSYYQIGTALYSPCVPMRIDQNAPLSVYPVASFSNASPITVVGIGENSLQEVSLFPNPSDGIITLRNLAATSTLTVFDVAGRIVVQQQVLANASQQISLENLEQGIYSVTIENETGFFHEEIVISH